MNADPHGPDWSDHQDGDEGPSCMCGFNGTAEQCKAWRSYMVADDE